MQIIPLTECARPSRLERSTRHDTGFTDRHQMCSLCILLSQCVLKIISQGRTAFYSSVRYGPPSTTQPPLQNLNNLLRHICMISRYAVKYTVLIVGVVSPYRVLYPIETLTRVRIAMSVRPYLSRSTGLMNPVRAQTRLGTDSDRT